MDTPSNSFHPNKKLPLKNASLAASWRYAELHTQAAVHKKTPMFGKSAKSKTSYSFLPIAFLLLFHSSSKYTKYIKNNFTETL